MQKTVIIFLCLVIFAGCSVKRKALLSTRDFDFEKPELLKISDVAELNFTAQPFFIQRADINIIGDDVSQSVMATIKFAKPDSFLISVRAFLGIEVARILLTSDTILINDRINRNLYFGSNQNIKNKFGFDLMFFPVLLGDLITAKPASSAINCNDGNAVLQEFGKGYIINYLIDCKTGKCREVKIENEFVKDYVSLEFDDFAKDGEMIFPTRVKANNFANFARIEIDIKNIEFNETSAIEFIPGRNYTQVEIK